MTGSPEDFVNQRRKYGVNAKSARELVGKTFEDIPFIIPGYVAPGLTLLVGKPKIGKSWLALGWAFAKAAGGTAMGSIQVEQGDVLYLALEDNERRLKKRFLQLASGQPLPPTLLYVTPEEKDWPRIGQGGIRAIEAELDTLDNAKLVIVDVVGKIMPLRNNKQDVYQADYAALAPLKKLADRREIGIVGLHHVSKRIDSEDPFDAVSGSTGLTGVADTILMLSRDSQGMKLYGRGRDVEEIETALSFDLSTGFFNTLGNADEVRRSSERIRILDVLRHATVALSPADIASAAGLKAVNVRQLLPKMVRDGQVVKDEKYGRYRLPAEAAAGKPNGHAKGNGFDAKSDRYDPKSDHSSASGDHSSYNQQSRGH